MISSQEPDETHPPKQNSSPKTAEVITATSKVCNGRYTETNTGPALSIAHVCIANAIAEDTTPCNNQFFLCHSTGIRYEKVKTSPNLSCHKGHGLMEHAMRHADNNIDTE